MKGSKGEKADEKTDNPRPGRMEVNKNAGWSANSCEIRPKTTKKPAISDWFLELMTGFEPVTSSLPRMRSTD